MNYTLQAGKHYAWPPATLPWIGEQRMERHVTFDASCAYELPDYNALDVNKLFGLSFGVRGVHWNSARFGWRWNAQAGCIDLVAYCYVNGKRIQDEQLRFPVVAQVKPGQRVGCSIEYQPATGCYLFSVDNPMRAHLVSTQAHLPCYGLTHGLYFGGELPAPHQMSVQIDRV